MALLRIYETPDPVLRQISTPVETVDDEIRALVSDMFDTMYDAPGIGLAAVQVGVPKRLLVMDLQEPEDPDNPDSPAVKEPRVFINPEILAASDTLVPYTEGCLSVLKRLAACYQTHEEELDGLLAVCLQHEMDHLEGVLFIDHLSKLKRDMVLKKLAKVRKDRGSRAA